MVFFSHARHVTLYTVFLHTGLPKVQHSSYSVKMSRLSYKRIVLKNLLLSLLSQRGIPYSPPRPLMNISLALTRSFCTQHRVHTQ